MTTIILGGGTFNDVAPHLSLCARAFGTTAKQLKQYCHKNNVPAQLVLTRMADSNSPLITNKDVEDYVRGLMYTTDVKAIIFSVAMCDFEGYVVGRSREQRLSSQHSCSMVLYPYPVKVIQLIKKYRPDIYVVGFKTTAGATSYEQVDLAREQITAAGCNLVFANDLTTRKNILVSDTFDTHNDRQVLLNEIAHEISYRCYQSPQVTASNK